MTIPVFDTHKAVKALTAAGFNGPQAEAVVDTFGGAMGETLVTKVDLKAELKDLKAGLAELEHRMTVKLGGLMAAGIGLLALVVGLF